MSNVALSGNALGTGTITLAAPNTSTNRALTLPDADGTIQISGNPISGTTGTFSGAVTFGDATQQNTAFTGARATAYTTAGTSTFTIPAGITALKITVVGGGGSSSYTSGCVAFAGVAGGTSSVSSGTQTISTISATGGAGQAITVIPNAGGAGSGGAINGRGGGGEVRSVSNTYRYYGASIFSFTKI